MIPHRFVSGILAALDESCDRCLSPVNEMAEGQLSRALAAASDATSVTAREQFLAVLHASPLMGADAIVVLCGEDGSPRVKAGVEAFRRSFAPLLLLSGGLSDPPRILSAEDLRGKAMGYGVAPDRIMTERESRNTREQAAAVVTMCHVAHWRRILLIASPYHAPRAFLTFVQAVADAPEQTVDLRVSVLPASATGGFPWWEAPAGCESTRLDLLASEMAKITAYQALGHVATYEAGLEYLKRWESAP